MTNASAIGVLLGERFLQTPHLLYDDTIHYAEVITWYGALRFASVTKNDALVTNLIARFAPLFDAEKQLLPRKNHVDFNMFGCLPLELYRITGDERYKKMGLEYADTQWQLPADATEEQKRFAHNGYTWQTRFWMDDMYMIGSVQTQGFRITNDPAYIERTAHEMVLYLDRLQRPGGLFFHTPDSPFYWGRANGWMAWAMADILCILPRDNPHYRTILNAYCLMMENLKAYQSSGGMWKQLIDDDACWDESSCTAMFVYALITGIKHGWLSASSFTGSAARGWDALCAHINTSGDITEVCAGTAAGKNKEHYYKRPRITGDYHGQAPVLWCAVSLLDCTNVFQK
ncbi:hypothetical protein AGMMS50268_36410 [Spirochaetia bacterium]|nr:hypothetical protein AGMMS50268_36410 [Spirochaetia bacterium]